MNLLLVFGTHGALNAFAPPGPAPSSQRWNHWVGRSGQTWVVKRVTDIGAHGDARGLAAAYDAVRVLTLPGWTAETADEAALASYFAGLFDTFSAIAELRDVVPADPDRQATLPARLEP